MKNKEINYCSGAFKELLCTIGNYYYIDVRLYCYHSKFQGSASTRKPGLYALL